MISIIIPTFNRCQFLELAVRSVLEQTYKDWELLVVDDGSDDESWKILRNFRDNRIHYLYQKHSGVSAARNTGIHLARFPWLCFLDSDDHWQPSKLSRQLEELKRHPQYQVIYTDEIWMRRGRRVNPKKTHRKYSGWIYHRCLPLCIISPSSILLHRHILEQEGLFDESFPVCEDYEMWLRVSSRQPILFLEEPLIVKVGGHADQLSSSLWGLDRYRVKALVKIYSSGCLTSQQELWTARKIVEKASILATGFANRNKWAEEKKYRRLVQNWSEKTETTMLTRTPESLAGQLGLSWSN
ncbi:glycosyltransferase [Acidobacteria bacterium AH-259-D05]|nr:glycosyltransferase [Acidobacteria bacterium AH-259-D05]